MTSLDFKNSRVQQLRRLLGRRSSRYEEGSFVVEGPVLVTEAIRAGWICEAQFVPENSETAIEGGGSIFELASGVLERVASTNAPQPPLAIVQMPEVGDVAERLHSASFVVALDRISDPGNLGTILRSAEAAGADLVVLTPGGVDPYNSKVVRAAAGALFHVPFVVAELDDVAAAGLRLVGTSSHSADGRTVLPHTDVDFTGRVAIVMGNEAAGLPDHWDDANGPIREWVTIPHRGRTESLNVAMATTVLAFEAARQRN
ncbi:MAG: TrmH family RNA methyltransferase [Minisyncoccia bacterium]|jgi:TrmH family RNA methyltransferase|uniref:TrmH family RNA methyltransferase n=1 Tax=uncultured Ilumatobacter sp. TaxID=879968 RepID=UPI00374F6430|tara:strand:+ start:756 stop:1532 length:777 start_codon:yes stop_codon:yes gene_type:complete